VSSLSIFSTGFLHPVLGIDHFVMALGVGLWSVWGRRRPDLRIPAAFLIAMSMGFFLGGLLGNSHSSVMMFANLEVPFSLIFLGCLLFWRPQFRWSWRMLFVGLFGAVHGHTHGVEMCGLPHLELALVGLVLSTAILHFSGVFGALILQRYAEAPKRNLVLRFFGVLSLLSAFFS
jgi:urease accessory protein